MNPFNIRLRVPITFLRAGARDLEAERCRSAVGAHETPPAATSCQAALLLFAGR